MRMERIRWAFEAAAGWGVLIGIPAAMFIGADLLMKATYNRVHQDGLKEAKEHVRWGVCVRQLFRDRAELLASEEAKREAKTARCTRFDSEWPEAWATDHSWEGVKAKDVFLDSFDRWLWSDQPMEPVHGLQGK